MFSSKSVQGSSELKEIYYQDATVREVQRGTPFTDRINMTGPGQHGDVVLTIHNVRVQDELEFICVIKHLVDGVAEGRTQLRVFGKIAATSCHLHNILLSTFIVFQILMLLSSFLWHLCPSEERLNCSLSNFFFLLVQFLIPLQSHQTVRPLKVCQQESRSMNVANLR